MIPILDYNGGAGAELCRVLAPLSNLVGRIAYLGSYIFEAITKYMFIHV